MGDNRDAHATQVRHRLLQRLRHGMLLGAALPSRRRHRKRHHNVGDQAVKPCTRLHEPHEVHRNDGHDDHDGRNDSHLYYHLPVLLREDPRGSHAAPANHDKSMVRSRTLPVPGISSCPSVILP